MAQSRTSKFYRTFTRGLITEASPLTYPEDTSADELNTIPSRKGNRVRRFGMNYANGNATSRDYNSFQAKNEFMWHSVASNPSSNFLCVQSGPIILFYDRSVSAFASSRKPFFVDLRLYTRPGISDPSASSCKFASGKGFLFIVSADIEPLVVRYDKVTNSIDITKIVILARDFEGLNDGLQNDEEPTVLTRNHLYNLLNQGWVSPKV